MVNWMLGHTSRFRAFVSHAGVFDLGSMFGSTEELWFPLWEFSGPPWDNPEMYARWSPSNFVRNFKTPTLVVHGEKDYRVPVSQAMQLFSALQLRDVPSRFLYFPDEGHWNPQTSKQRPVVRDGHRLAAAVDEHGLPPPNATPKIRADSRSSGNRVLETSR